MLTRRQWHGLDKPLMGVAFLLLGVGLLVLYSASFQKAQLSGVSYVSRQATWMALALLVAAVLVVVDYHRWLEWAYLLYGLNTVLLLLVLVLGEVRGGAQRWLSFGSFLIQPSEFAKVTTVLALARVLGSQLSPTKSWQAGREGSLRSGWRGLALTAALVAVPILLILKEPNLGTASVFIPIALSMLLVWGIPGRLILGFLAAGAVAVPLALHRLADYQRSRLMVFLNPNLDPLGAGYTVVQSKIAIGSGGLWGRGWMAGTQNQLNFLPERHTDFIFSVLGEEWGFLGTTLCLALFGFLFYRAFLIAGQTRDPFGRLLVVGLIAMLASHLVVNTGMALGLMPVVGLPLPFLSYGGSWLLTCLTSIGIILSVGIRRPVF